MNTEETYWKERQFTLDLINLIPAAIFWKNKNEIFIGCNQYFADLAGINSPADIIGKTDFQLPWARKQALSYQQDDQEVIRTGKAKLNIEEALTLRDGREIVLLTNKTPLFASDGQIMGVLGIFYDITERKKTELALAQAKEQAEAANIAKSEFLENMSHNLRTPLSGIIGFSSIIKEEIQDPKLKQYADHLSDSANALLNLLNEILDIIRWTAGKTPLKNKKFNLRKKLEEVVQLHRASAEQKGIDLQFTFNESLPEYLIGDSMRIYRVVLELISNAITFTSNGKVQLFAEAHKYSDNKIVIKLVVKDTGIGIPAEYLQDIFHEFKRLTPSHTGLYQGIGLGLTLVNQLVNDLGAEIYVESEVGQGSTFTCLIPLTTLSTTAPEETEDPKESRQQTIHPQNQNNYRILVVEDNSIAATVAQVILNKLGCQVDVVVNGLSAVDKIKMGNHYDLIFMDIGLPDIDGYETTRKIRQLEQEEPTSYIVALTAHGDEHSRQFCLAAGMNALVTKPLTKEKALEVISDLSSLPSYSLAIIDYGKALAQVNQQDHILFELLSLFEQSLPTLQQEIAGAYELQNWNKLISILQKLKTSASYCCAEGVKDACNKLELALSAHQYPLIAELMARLSQQIEQVENYLHDLLKNHI